MSWTPNEEQRAAIDARGRVFVSAGAGPARPLSSSSASSRPCATGARRRVDPRHHLHEAGGRRAAGAHSCRAPAPRPRRPGPEPRRRLHLDDPRLLQPAAEGVSVRSRSRPTVPRAGRRAGLRPLERGLRRGARCVLQPGRRGARATADHLRRARLAADDHRDLRDAPLGRPRPRPRARRSPPIGERLEELREAARCLVEDDSATELQRGSAAALLNAVSGKPRADDLLDLSAHRARGERSASFEEAVSPSSRRPSTSSRCATGISSSSS